MIIDSKFPSTGGGGAESQIVTLGNSLQQDDHRVDVLGPLLREGPQERFSKVDDLNVIRVPYPRIRLFGSLILHLRTALWMFKNLKNYDVVHAHIAHHFVATSVVVANLAKKPIFVKITGFHELSQGFLIRGDVSLRLQLLQYIFSKVTGFHAISTEISNRLLEYGSPAEKIHLIPNAVDDERFSPTELAPPVDNLPVDPGERKVVIFVGRLVPEKALDLLLQAWASSQTSRPEALLLIVGKGPLLEELKQLTESLDITDSVHFLGPRSDIPELLAISSFMVLPSLEEGLSNTLLEAMASGLPSLVSQISGNEDFIRHLHNGWLVQPGEVTELTETLSTALNTEPEQLKTLGNNARQTIMERCSVSHIKKLLLKMYAGALA